VTTTCAEYYEFTVERAAAKSLQCSFRRAAASGRMDIPKDDIDVDHKLVEGKKYWD